MEECKVFYQSRIGLLEIVGTDAGLNSIIFIERVEGEEYANPATILPIVAACVRQLDGYFRGDLREFSLQLSPEGTDFQKSVWEQLVDIPYGNTVSYLDIAKSLNNEQAVRAVGAANGQNPISIVVPCHRVIGSDGKLIGYGGGLWRKQWLLNHERQHSSGQLPLF